MSFDRPLRKLDDLNVTAIGINQRRELPARTLLKFDKPRPSEVVQSSYSVGGVFHMEVHDRPARLGGPVGNVGPPVEYELHSTDLKRPCLRLIRREGRFVPGPQTLGIATADQNASEN